MLEALVGTHLLQPPLLLLHVCQPADVRHSHSAILAIPVAVRGVR